MRNDKLQVGIIGLGNIARDRHLPAWNHVPFVEVAALADTSEAALQKAAALRPDARQFSDWQELIALDDLDIVDICTPTALHAPMALAAMNRGKHVLCEKPLAANLAEVDELAAMAQTAGKLLMTGQVFRFLPVSAQLFAQIQDGRLGEIYFTRAQWLRRRRLPPAATFIQRSLSGGGPLLDIGVHVLDLACWFLGFPEPVSVTAFTSDRLAHRMDLGSEWGDWPRERFDVEDFAAGMIRFANGSVLTLEASWLGFTPDDELMRIQCLGTEAGLVWPDGVLVGESQNVPWTMRLDKAQERHGFDEQIRQFAVAVRDAGPSPVPVSQTRIVIQILEAMYRSAQAGREIRLQGTGGI